MSYFTNNIDKRILKQIAERFFIGNPVKISQKLEAQSINECREYVLGCRAGPESSHEYLFHEMAHLAEREIDKIIERPFSGWGFSFGKYWEIGGRSGWEPQTEQSVLREARVWAYQSSLLNEFKINHNIEDLVSSATYLPAFCLFKFNRTPKNLEYSERELAALNVLAGLVKNLTEKYTFKSFEENWFKRMKALKNS